MNNRERGRMRREGNITIPAYCAHDTATILCRPSARLEEDKIIIGNYVLPKDVFVDAYNKWIKEDWKWNV